MLIFSSLPLMGLEEIIKKTWPMVDLWPGPEQSDIPHPLPFPWHEHSASSSHSESPFQGHGLHWTICSCNYLDSICNWTQVRSLYELKILPRKCRDLPILQSSKTSFMSKSSLLSHQAPYSVGWPASFFGLSLPSRYWASIRVYLENSQSLPGKFQQWGFLCILAPQDRRSNWQEN